MEFINTKYTYCYKFATYCYIFATCSIAYPCSQVFVAVLAGSTIFQWKFKLSKGCLNQSSNSINSLHNKNVLSIVRGYKIIGWRIFYYPLIMPLGCTGRVRISEQFQNILYWAIIQLRLSMFILFVARTDGRTYRKSGLELPPLKKESAIGDSRIIGSVIVVDPRQLSFLYCLWCGHN